MPRRWIGSIRAAEVARASAATLEARQHVRAAIEFASPDDLPELQELLADVEIGGTLIVDIYEKALELARAAGRGRRHGATAPGQGHRGRNEIAGICRQSNDRGAPGRAAHQGQGSHGRVHERRLAGEVPRGGCFLPVLGSRLVWPRHGRDAVRGGGIQRSRVLLWRASSMMRISRAQRWTPWVRLPRNAPIGSSLSPSGWSASR